MYEVGGRRRKGGEGKRAKHARDLPSFSTSDGMKEKGNRDELNKTTMYLTNLMNLVIFGLWLKTAILP